MVKRRDMYFDFVRSISVIWIVCVWHLSDYFIGSDFHRILHLLWGKSMTDATLASFTLLSGLFLGIKPMMKISDMLMFYKNRLIRFYPLFLVASIIMYYTPCYWTSFYHSFNTLLCSIVGLSCFIPPQPSTLWYMAMLLVFYILTPIVLLYQAPQKRLVLGILIWFIFFVQKKYLINLDIRVIYYWPFYVIGLSLNPSLMKEYLGKYLKYILILSILVVVTMSYFNNLITHIFYIFGVTSVYLSVIAIIFRYKNVEKRTKKIVEFISSASMAAYLFHRQIYSIISPEYTPYLIPIIFVISWYIQLIYNKIIFTYKK